MGSLIFRHFLWIAWLLLLIILSLTPGNNLPDFSFELFEIDKLVHFTFYFMLMILMNLGFRTKKNEPYLKSIVLIGVIGLFIGWSIEYIQGEFILNRYFDYFDIVANSIGIVSGIIFYYKVSVRKL